MRLQHPAMRFRRSSRFLTVEVLEDRCLLSAHLVKDINSFRFGSDPSLLVDVNGTLFFSADDGVHGGQLWKSDGTEKGTVMVKEINPGHSASLRHLTVMNGVLFFGAFDVATHTEVLWKSDGTNKGTV